MRKGWVPLTVVSAVPSETYDPHVVFPEYTAAHYPRTVASECLYRAPTLEQYPPYSGTKDGSAHHWMCDSCGLAQWHERDLTLMPLFPDGRRRKLCGVCGLRCKRCAHTMLRTQHVQQVCWRCHFSGPSRVAKAYFVPTPRFQTLKPLPRPAAATTAAAAATASSDAPPVVPKYVPPLRCGTCRRWMNDPVQQRVQLSSSSSFACTSCYVKCTLCNKGWTPQLTDPIFKHATSKDDRWWRRHQCTVCSRSNSRPASAASPGEALHQATKPPAPASATAAAAPKASAAAAPAAKSMRQTTLLDRLTTHPTAAPTGKRAAAVKPPATGVPSPPKRARLS